MPDPQRIVFTTGTPTIEARAADRPATITALAYGGDPMSIGGTTYLIELSGMSRPDSIPLLRDHTNRVDAVLGTVSTEIRGGRLHASGTLARGTPGADHVIGLARSGIDLAVSIGVEPTETTFVPAGKTIEANGRRHVAPAGGMYYVGRSHLRELSVVACGADRSATARIAASAEKGFSMTFEQWLAANGFDASTITDQQRAALQASWRSQHGAVAPAELEQIQARWQAARFYYTGEHAGPYQRAQQAFVQASAGLITADQFDRTLSDELLRDAKLKITRDERPQGPVIHAGRQGANGVAPAAVIEAAFLRHLGRETLAEKELGAAAVQAAADLRCHHALDIIKASLQLAGRDIPSDRNQMIRAGFSLADVAGILGNAANKSLLDAYRSFPSVARQIARKLSANDFKSHTGYRMTGDTKFLEVPPAGEIHHGTLGEASYTYSIKTFGRMFALTRQDIINDDLGAFNEMPQAIGRGCAVTVEEQFWQFVLANGGTFFGSGNLNYIDGATSVLAVTGLGLGVKKMREFVDADGNPVMVEPVFLVVPPALEVAADQLYTSSNLLVVPDSAASDTTTQPDGNPFRNKYKPLVVPHLGNSTYSGYSATAWYLFGNPSDVAAFGMAYLNGQESPTIESSDTDFATLGVQYRGYLDWGVCQIDAKGAVKSAGA